MKPRLYKCGPLWHCTSVLFGGMYIAVGDTPRAAFAKWQEWKEQHA